MQIKQLPLDVRLADAHRFDSFVDDHAALALSLLRQLAAGDPVVGQQVFLHGPSGSGKTHLLQAACHEAAGVAASCAYLPLKRLRAHDPQSILEGFEEVRLLCIDELDAVALSPAWQKALFTLINRIRERGHRLVLAARQPPEGLGIELPDLVSRLVWGPVFRLETPDDDDLKRILLRKAAARGLELEDRVCTYLVRHESRNPRILLDLLDHLDLALLESRRRLTVPFVREQLRQRWLEAAAERSDGA